MPSTYPGNAGNVSLGTAVAVTLPSDGDGLVAASVAIPGVTLADYVEALRQGSAFAPHTIYAHLIGALVATNTYLLFPGMVIAVGSADTLYGANPIAMPYAGVLRNLRIGVRGGTIAGGTISTTVVKNSVGTAMTATVLAGGQYASDLTHPISFAAGDNIVFSTTANAGVSGGTGFGIAVQVTLA